jgi:hypothetical protein
MRHDGRDMKEAEYQTGYAKYQQYSEATRQWIAKVQADGLNNRMIDEGHTAWQGKPMKEWVSALYADANVLPTNATLYRWQNIPPNMLKQIATAEPGLVFQSLGGFCTSQSPTATSNFGPHQLKIRVAEGAKALHSHGSGKHQSEKVITTLPGQRYVLLGKKTEAEWELGNRTPDAPAGRKLHRLRSCILTRHMGTQAMANQRKNTDPRISEISKPQGMTFFAEPTPDSMMYLGSPSDVEEILRGFAASVHKIGSDRVNRKISGDEGFQRLNDLSKEYQAIFYGQRPDRYRAMPFNSPEGLGAFINKRLGLNGPKDLAAYTLLMSTANQILDAYHAYLTDELSDDDVQFRIEAAVDDAKRILLGLPPIPDD